MINVDIGNVWGAISLPDLLAAEKEVFDAHLALTEDGCRPDWMDIPGEEPPEELDRVLAAAERIRENSDVLVVLGVDGACLGAQAAIALLQGRERNLRESPRIFFAGNALSTRQWNELVKLLEGKDFSVCVVCRSGCSLEPAIALRSLKWMLERRYGTDEAKKRIYAVTAEDAGALGQMAKAAGWESFALPGNVSGAFGVLSPGGLLSAAVAGIDIRAVLRGAREARDACDLRSFENPVWLYAAVRNLLYRSGKKIELLGSFEPGFGGMGLWWRQLFGQTEGKDGKGIFPVAAQLPGDLYGLERLLREGERNLFETVLRFDPPEMSMHIGEDVNDLDGLNCLAGRSLDSVQEQVLQTMVETHVESGIPVVTIDCGGLTEETVGQLFWFFQLSCSLSACMQGIVPAEYGTGPAENSSDEFTK